MFDPKKLFNGRSSSIEELPSTVGVLLVFYGIIFLFSFRECAVLTLF